MKPIYYVEARSLTNPDKYDMISEHTNLRAARAARRKEVNNQIARGFWPEDVEQLYVIFRFEQVV
jgi:hypothetical protein